jgi:hypothetical protein
VTIQSLAFEVLDVTPQSVIVVRSRSRITPVARDLITRQLREIWPNNRVVILDCEDLQIVILDPPVEASHA